MRKTAIGLNLYVNDMKALEWVYGKLSTRVALFCIFEKKASNTLSSELVQPHVIISQRSISKTASDPKLVFRGRQVLVYEIKLSTCRFYETISTLPMQFIQDFI
jgi:hypothetical protein